MRNKNAMNSPEGQEMMETCGNIMESYDDNVKNESDKTGLSQSQSN